MEATAEALGSGARGSDDAYAAALEHWLVSGAPDLDERLPAVLADLGLHVGPDALMTSRSGGQSARAALAALLLSRFDLVLLDEPTNDLDLAGLERPESFVRGLRTGVVLVSHDREFLSRCVTRVVELDLAQHSVAVYDGATTRSWRSGRSPDGTPVRPTTSSRTPGPTSSRGRAPSRE